MSNRCSFKEAFSINNWKASWRAKQLCLLWLTTFSSRTGLAKNTSFSAHICYLKWLWKKCENERNWFFLFNSYHLFHFISQHYLHWEQVTRHFSVVFIDKTLDRSAYYFRKTGICFSFSFISTCCTQSHSTCFGSVCLLENRTHDFSSTFLLLSPISGSSYYYSATFLSWRLCHINTKRNTNLTFSKASQLFDVLHALCPNKLNVSTSQYEYLCSSKLKMSTETGLTSKKLGAGG